jgi:hypothetical protein
MKTLFQSLNLKTGEKASCVAGHPVSQLVTVVCIKDFETSLSNWDSIINNAMTYVKVTSGILLTSHLISSNWIRS